MQKNIVWLCPGFAANESDSQCIPPLQLLAKALEESKAVRLQIVALHYPFRSKPYIWNNISVYPCHHRGLASRWRIWSKAFRVLKDLQQQQKIDGLHSFWLTDAAFIGHWASRYLSCPHWVTLAGQDAKRSNRYLHFLPFQQMNTIALSSFHAKVWKASTGQSPKHLIPWGIESLAETTSSEDRPIDIIGVGNLIELKDYLLFVELIAELLIKRPNLKALIIGDGTERPMLQKLIDEKGLANNLQLAGALPRQEVMKYMQQSKVFFHPSTYESFGFVLLEAMTNGLHIVSRPVGIAQKSDQWWIGNNFTELKEGLEEALLQFNEPKPRNPYPLATTLQSYLTIYQQS